MNAAITAREYPWGRGYPVPGGPYPSVTTVLDATKSPEDRAGLARWRESVGEEEAERIRLAAAERGSALHQEIEDACLFGTISSPSPWLESIRGEVEEYVASVSRLSERVVWHPQYRYAGTLDGAGLVDGRLVLWDWKSYLPSNPEKQAKPRGKRAEHVRDHLLQCRAYAKALGYQDRVAVDELRVVVARCAVRDGDLVPMAGQVFCVTRKDDLYDDLWSEWLLRLSLWQVEASERGEKGGE